ncbi:MAG: flagellar biosynthesis protein FlgA, partial [Gammaproteobacteria bacterium]|nr:flagellar biosynthesis protein FlgA [Gammaproteobacteria bacterium]
EVLNADLIDVVIESTGDAIAGANHALASIDRGIDIVMVNVEADVLVGPLLAEKARQNDVIYSLAYGDQPALIVEQVDTVRTMGLDVICAGKGTKYLPVYHASTPETVWDYYGLTRTEAELGGMNSKMFNSFLDGTKSGIEMAAVANATGLTPPSDGLSFPPCSVDELASVLKPTDEGGVLAEKGMVEVISSFNRDGSEIERDLRWGVYVVFEAGTEYVKRCFREYGLVTDESGRYSALYRPYHLIGLELGVSVASVALRREPTGIPRSFTADVASVAKRDLAAGELLDGEGGSTVWGKILPAVDSLTRQAVPIGLASGIEITRPVAEGDLVTWKDVRVGDQQIAHGLRWEMEKQYCG